MGRIPIILNNDVENKFRESLSPLRKGDMSKKVQNLILKDLGENVKSEKKLLKSLFNKMDALILKCYNSPEFSLLAANKIALDWDKIKSKYI